MAPSRGHASAYRFTRTEVVTAIAQFQELLDSKASEQTVHTFLASHIYFWNGMLRLLGGCPLYSKIQLGSEHEAEVQIVQR